jgi:hypothetical protein
MDKTERRKYQRVKVFDPISYSFVDSGSNAVVENISVALNASQNGIQIQTLTEIQSKNIRLKFINLEQNTFEVEGEVIYCAKQQSGIFKIGVRLMGTDAENVYFVKQLVRFYHYGKEKSRAGIVQVEQNSQPNNIDVIQL